MTFDDDPKLPRAVLRGENLYIVGENAPYFRDTEFPVYLEVTDLWISDGFGAQHLGDSPKQLAASLYGLAKLKGEDKFAVAGMETDPSSPIEFQLRHPPENETKFHWRATIHFTEGFRVVGFCPAQSLAVILAAVRTGRVEKLRVTMETTMWTKQKSSGLMHVAPPVDKDSTTPAGERGTITDIAWDESYGLRTTKPEGGAPVPKPVLVELPARLYSVLGTIIAIGIVIVVLLFLRH